MEPVVIAPNGCASAVRYRGIRLFPGWERIGTILLLAAVWASPGGSRSSAQSQTQPPDKSRTPAGSTPKSILIRESRGGPQRPGTKPGPAPLAPARTSSKVPKPAVEEVQPPAPEPAPSQAKRFRIRDRDSGLCVVARLHGQYEGKTALLQPDGQIGYPNMLVPADEPFVPMTSEALQARLQERAV